MADPYADLIAQPESVSSGDPYAHLISQKAAAGRSGQPTEGNAVTRIGQAAVEGLKAPFKTPVEGASPEVQNFIDQSHPGIMHYLNQVLLDAIPQAVQYGLKAAAAPVSAVTGAAGQAVQEVGGLPGASLKTAPDVTAAMNEQAGAVGADLGIPAAGIQTPVRIPQLKGPSKNLEPGAAAAAKELSFQKQPKTVTQSVLGLPASPVTIPAQRLTTSPVLDMMSNAAETSFLGRAKMSNATAQSTQAATNLVGDFVDTWFNTGATKEQVGIALKGAFQGSTDAFHAAAKGAYKAVDDALAADGAAGPLVDLTTIKKTAAQIQDEIQRSLPALHGASQMPDISIGGRSLNLQQAKVLSRAESLADGPFLVFDPRKSKGYEGVFPTQQEALDFIEKTGNKFDYGTPRSIEKMNPSGPESDAFIMQRLNAALQKARYANSNSSGPGFLQNILNKPDFVTFQDAQLIRSDLLQLGYNISDPLPARAEVIGKRLVGTKDNPGLDKAMSDAAETLGPNAKEAWRNANKLWKDGKEVFNSDMMKAIANKQPDAIYQSLVKDNRPTNIRLVRDTLGPTAWKEVQSVFVNDMVENSINKTTGDLNGDGLLQQIRKHERGNIYNEIITDKGSANRLKELANTLKVTQGSNATGALKMKQTIGGYGIGSLPEIGGLTLVYNSPTIGGKMLGGAITFGPRTFSRILTSPRMTKWLIDGIGNPSGSVRGANATRNLITAMVVNGLVDKSQNPTDNLNKLNAAQAAANLQHNTKMKLSTSGPIVPIGP